ncbi:PBP superfamily domain protein [uncultured archaeon]|nr:PBP superfamily domain protein [uncultured archaeon]
MVILIISLAAMPISQCSATSREVTVSGSSTVMPLAEAAAEIFNVQQNNYTVTVTAGGTGAGITGIAERKYSVAMASREITADERNRYGNLFQEFLIGLDGICLAVSENIYESGVKSLSREQVRKIYLGNITNWKEVGGPDRDIYVISREEGSGTRDNFNEEIFGSTDAETPGVDTVAMGSAEVKTAIAGSDKAIGYLGFNYLGSGVRAIAFNGIMPSYENIKLDLYELHRHLYFYTFGEPQPGARAFIDFVRSPKGQKIAAEEGFVPI